MSEDERLFWKLYRQERSKIVPKKSKINLRPPQIIACARAARKRMDIA